MTNSELVWVAMAMKPHSQKPRKADGYRDDAKWYWLQFAQATTKRAEEYWKAKALDAEMWARETKEKF